MVNKIAITGANGFVARNLRSFLNSKKIPVVAIARKNFKAYPLETKIISKTYSDDEVLSKLSDCTAIFHLIGIGKQTINSDYISINSELTKKIIQTCKKAGIRKIVYNSGLGVSKNTNLGYFISKYKAEQAIVDSGLDYTIFRPSYIIGKDDLLSQNLKKQIKKNIVIIPGSGRFNIQPIFIDDAIRILFQALSDKKLSYKILDLVGPQLVTFEKFVKCFVCTSKVKIIKQSLEKSYYKSIHDPTFPYGVDDLNILVGNFMGDHKKLKKLSNFEFTEYVTALKTCGTS